ncbi:MAG: threonylcarbamoyl-AMP synthase [Acidobacteriota bacterium]|nr:MAG: threonylcarbamoyl-AMP synthase [Acidobacteriota bacterium]
MWVELDSSEAECTKRAAEVVRRGGVAFYPTDTIYGLGCDPFNERAVERIFDIKKRPAEKGVLLLISGIEWFERLSAEVSLAGRELAQRFWPGPLTLIVKPRPDVPPWLLGREGKLGMRWPAPPFLRSWLSELEGPLVSTSANLSGEPVPSTIEEMRQLFQDKVDLFIEADLEAGPASTVVDVTVEPARIVRAGALAEEIGKVLRI